MSRKSSDILPQIVRRLSEEISLQKHTDLSSNLVFNDYSLKNEHFGLLIEGTSNPQFKEAIFQIFNLK